MCRQLGLMEKTHPSSQNNKNALKAGVYPSRAKRGSLYRLYIVHCIHCIHCTLYTLYTLYIIFTVHCVHCTCVHCILYTLSRSDCYLRPMLSFWRRAWHQRTRASLSLSPWCFLCSSQECLQEETGERYYTINAGQECWT